MYPDTDHATHPNGMRFTVFDAGANAIASDVFYSIGGGFILSAKELEQSSSAGSAKRDVPYPFSSGEELLRLGEQHQLSIPEIILRNEVALLGDPTITRRIDRIVSPARPGNEAPPDMASLTPEQQIQAAILTLVAHDGAVHRARAAHRRHAARRAECAASCAGACGTRGALDAEAAASAADRKPRPRDPLAPLDTVTMVAMAVNEENAAGGRVVTAPTNGAAGVIPAIAYYYLHHAAKASSDARGSRACCATFLRRRRSAFSTRRMRRSQARRLAARVRWALRARWPRVDWWPR